MPTCCACFRRLFPPLCDKSPTVTYGPAIAPPSPSHIMPHVMRALPRCTGAASRARVGPARRKRPLERHTNDTRTTTTPTKRPPSPMGGRRLADDAARGRRRGRKVGGATASRRRPGPSRAARLPRWGTAAAVTAPTARASGAASPRRATRWRGGVSARHGGGLLVAQARWNDRSSGCSRCVAEGAPPVTT
jgi:hypothetical protein